MGSVYCTTTGSALRKDHEALQIYKEGDLYTGIPFQHISRLIVTSNVSVSTGVLMKCLALQIPVSLLYSNGRYAGSLHSGLGKNSPLRNLQYAIAFSDADRLTWSRQIVRVKLRNIRSLLRDFGMPQNIPAISAILRKIKDAPSLDTLRGYEGTASRYVFQLIREVIPSHWEFAAREKHPPPDPANAVISLCYTLLFHQVFEAVSTAGFDPYRGWFHETAYGHPAFVSDMCELYRQVIADYVIVTILQHPEITPEQFKPVQRGSQTSWQADTSTFQMVIQQMEERLEQQRTLESQQFTIRQWIRQDVQDLAHALTETGDWNPVRLRR